MDIDQIEDFVALARVLNFSRAAQERNMTQPAFSRRIKALEDSIGTPLMARTTRTVALTAAGRAFLPRAESIVRAVRDAKTEALAAAGVEQRGLTLAATHALSYTFVPHWLMKIADPAAIGTLNLVSDSYHACRHLMAQGDVNFFISHMDEGNIEGIGAGFTGHVVGQDKLVPLCVPDADGKPKWQFGDDAPVLGFAPASGLHDILARHWARFGKPVFRSKMRSVLAASNLEMAKSGQGIAWLPETLARDAINVGQLVEVGHGQRVPLAIVIHRPKARMSSHCEAIWQRVLASTNANLA